MAIFWATTRLWQSNLGCSKVGLHFTTQKAKFQFGSAFWGAKCSPTFEQPKFECQSREVAKKIGMNKLFTNILKSIENIKYEKD